jgi:hypothetical protein
LDFTAWVSPVFVQNYWEVVQTLTAHPTTLIQIVSSTDVICQACPHLREKTGCKDFAKTNLIDQRHLEVLSLKLSQVISWDKAKQVIKERMTEEKFNYACATCEWKSYGVCLKAVKNL